MPKDVGQCKPIQKLYVMSKLEITNMAH
jgi:hypothetical protein